MLDPELRFIAGLLHAPENDQNEFYLRQIPPDLFLMHEGEMSWVHRYRQNHQRYPSAQTFRARFGIKLPRPKDPINGLLESVLGRISYQHLKNANKRIRELIDRKVPESSIVAAYKEDAAALQTFELGVQDVDRNQSTSVEAAYRERFLQNRDPQAKFIRSPWPTLNKLCPVFFPKEAMYLSGRFSLGKTWLAQFWAHWLAFHSVRTLFVSYEMDRLMMETRDESIFCGVPFGSLLDACLTPKQLRRWNEKKRERKKMFYPLHILEPKRTDNTFAALEESIHRIKPQVVVVDAFYKSKHPDMKRMNSEPARLGFIASMGKEVAKETNTFFVGTIQSGRQSEDKKGKTVGNASGQYGSDQWGQDADYIAEVSGQRGSQFRTLSLHKGRNRGIGYFNIHFDVIGAPNFLEQHLNVQDQDSDAPTHDFVALK